MPNFSDPAIEIVSERVIPEGAEEADAYFVSLINVDFGDGIRSTFYTRQESLPAIRRAIETWEEEYAAAHGGGEGG